MTRSLTFYGALVAPGVVLEARVGGIGPLSGESSNERQTFVWELEISVLSGGRDPPLMYSH